MATKRELTNFNKAISNLIFELGGNEKVASKHELRYLINTKAGALDIYLSKPEYHSAIFSIFCKFDNVKSATPILRGDERLNKHNGKWNFHTFDAEEGIQLFTNSLKSII